MPHAVVYVATRREAMAHIDIHTGGHSFVNHPSNEKFGDFRIKDKSVERLLANRISPRLRCKSTKKMSKYQKKCKKNNKVPTKSEYLLYIAVRVNYILTHNEP